MRLPIFKCVMDAYRDLLAHPKMFLLAAAIILPVALFLPEALPHWDASPNWTWEAICLLPFVAFALVWLRLRLQVAQGVGRQQRAPSEGLVTYLGVGSALLMLLWLPVISYPLIVVLFLELGRVGLLQNISGWLNEDVAAVALVPAWSYLLVRVSVMLPATVQGKPADPRAAWYATAGNGWRLTAACLLATLPLLFLAVALPYEIANQDFYLRTAMDRTAIRLIAAPLELAAAALFMNVLDSAYRRLPPGGSPGSNQILQRFE